MLLRTVSLAALASLLFVPSAPAKTPLQRGAELYARDCLTCHGVRGLGVPESEQKGASGIPGAGPPLVGVGARAAHFYLSTGYMPLSDPHDQPTREAPLYGPADLQAIIDYVASLGAGPPVPAPHPERGDVAEGFRLYRENCASCHQIVGEGGIVTGGVPPPLSSSTPVEIAEAVRIGPYVMPRFGEQQLDDRELDSIIRYVLRAQDPVDRGGWGIGHIGPVPEGLVAWLVGALALVLVALVIGERRES